MAVTIATNYTDISKKEDVSDVITIIDPVDTPVLANIGEQDIDNPDQYEWQTDGLAAAVTTGMQEGFAFSDLSDSVTERVKYRAICQIQAKGVSVSNRREKTDKYGVDSEMAYQLAKRAEEMKRDCEATILTYRDPQASNPGTAEPLCSGIPSWIRTNGSYGADPDGGGPLLAGAAPGLSASSPFEPAVTQDGAARAVDESILLGLIGGCYDEGGNPDMIFAPRAVKQKMSQYFFGSSARIATPYQDHGKNPSSGLQVVGAVDYYVSDFGTLALAVCRQIRSTDVLILDTSTWEKGTFRGYELHEIAKTGDSEEAMLVHDFTLIARAEEANARFAAADGTADMVS